MYRNSKEMFKFMFEIGLNVATDYEGRCILIVWYLKDYLMADVLNRVDKLCQVIN